ncbi:flagellar export protein FliJ [Desulfitobacterium sp.]|uniref:flagellar export protein FliJ n=1 Tax=Desulfitobacterium sp. TaxID=49981 RepID=UPI002B210578|nr:flagellar export protein FliJ [Desulfitobacterium sp.]MEA4900840.1 flagellar export protein FliJ [Desulfitobacterium sp.]
MPRFKFRLEAPLRLTERELDNERRSLAKEFEKLQQKQALCLEKEKQWQNALQGQKDAGIKAPETLGRWQGYSLSLHQQFRKLQSELAQQEEVISRQRLRVKKAHQEQEKLRKLKVKQEAAFWLKEQRREQQVLDEAGQVIFIRRREQRKLEAEGGAYL